jgi:hypothetical protein
MEYLRNSTYFNDNKNKLYIIEDSDENPFLNYGSRKNKDKLVLHNDSEISHLSFQEIEEDNRLLEDKSIDTIIDDILEDVVGGKGDIEKVYETEETEDDDDSSNNSLLNYSSEDDSEEDSDKDDETDKDESESEESDESEQEESEEESEEESDEEEESEESEQEYPPLYAYINDFPVQLICLENCKGTIDSLFSEGILHEDEAASALFQIIMNLLAFQKAFHFTHNDLHTNNIMYIETTEKYLYYKFNNTFYKIPTYGKIYKIIDFGRAIYKFQGKTYCSDSFGPDGDANTQYNFEPYFNEKKPRLEPNYSFDLCRLGCSIFDFILDEDYLDSDEELDELQRTVIRWCSDDNGKNVLYKRSGEERYPNFKLYKMIVRTVHEHTPEAQLSDPYFSQFEISEKKFNKDKSSSLIDIDKIPCYV